MTDELDFILKLEPFGLQKHLVWFNFDIELEALEDIIDVVNLSCITVIGITSECNLNLAVPLLIELIWLVPLKKVANIFHNI